jgi:hypothetical protein
MTVNSPEPGAAGYLEERATQILDIFMQMSVNAREREADDWKDIFAKADPRYQLKRKWKPEMRAMMLVEAEWTGE